MHIEKKPGTVTGQKNTRSYCQPLAVFRQGADDYQKPARQDRRQKRGWKRAPKKTIDQSGQPWQSNCTALQHAKHLAVSAPVSQSGFFTSIGFDQWSGSAQSCNSLRVKAASGLDAVLKYLTTPQQGGFSTNHLGAIMAKTNTAGAVNRRIQPTCTPGLTLPRFSLRLAVYRSVRRLAGPVLAYRLAFAFAADCGVAK